jgi:signal transduction histidine kinase
MTASRDDASADRWLALLAGANTWDDPERRPNITVRSSGGAQVLALGASLAVLLCFAAVEDGDGIAALRRAAPIALAATTAVCAIGPTLTFLGHTRRTRPLGVNFAFRSLVGLAMVGGIFGSAPGWAALLSTGLGIVIGADTSLTAYAIGWQPSPRQLWWALVSSPMHLGVVGGLLGTALAVPDIDVGDTLLPVYLTVHLWVAVACLTAWAISRMIRAEEARSELIRIETARSEHRRSAHWLHDDVCAQLRLVTLRLHRGAVPTDEVVGMLDELDFALRLRQLDELLQSGTARLAEVLQPFVRNAQNHGVTVERVPSYETASAVVDREAGQMLRHAASVLTSNALNAGATRLSFDVAVDAEQVHLALVDDAGGFDHDDLTAGRGLWSLLHELGPGNLTIARVDGGSRVTAHVDRHQQRPRTPAITDATLQEGRPRAASAAG